MHVAEFKLCCSWRSLCLALALIIAAPAFGAPVITEFMAANESTLRDEDGEFSDWIEIHNSDSAAVSLQGYHLTDTSADLRKWTLPAVTLEPGAYLVVFASGKDRMGLTGGLHTDFQLSSEGEYLAFVAPDGITVLSSLAPVFPPQFDNESFGRNPLDGSWSFFSAPTPGAQNGNGTRAGPIVSVLEKDPSQVTPGPLVVQARVLAAND